MEFASNGFFSVKVKELNLQLTEVISKGNSCLFVRLGLWLGLGSGLGLGLVLATKNRSCIVHPYSFKIVYNQWSNGICK